MYQYLTLEHPYSNRQQEHYGNCGWLPFAVMVDSRCPVLYACSSDRIWRMTVYAVNMQDACRHDTLKSPSATDPVSHSHKTGQPE